MKVSYTRMKIVILQSKLRFSPELDSSPLSRITQNLIQGRYRQGKEQNNRHLQLSCGVNRDPTVEQSWFKHETMG